jgi:hypothetical protein
MIPSQVAGADALTGHSRLLVLDGLGHFQRVQLGQLVEVDGRFFGDSGRCGARYCGAQPTAKGESSSRPREQKMLGSARE